MRRREFILGNVVVVGEGQRCSEFPLSIPRFFDRYFERTMETLQTISSSNDRQRYQLQITRNLLAELTVLGPSFDLFGIKLDIVLTQSHR